MMDPPRPRRRAVRHDHRDPFGIANLQPVPVAFRPLGRDIVKPA
jgi:hypothetical protein